MKVISLGIAGYLAERADVEVVYYIGGTLLVIAGLTGIIALPDERLKEPAPTPNSSPHGPASEKMTEARCFSTACQ